MAQYNEGDLVIFRNGELVGVAINDIATDIGNEIDLIELKDVNTGNKLNGDSLIWDSVNLEWTNRNLNLNDISGFDIEPGDNDGDLLTWDSENETWVSTDPSTYLNSYSEEETTIGSWTGGQPLTRKVIEIDTPLLAGVEKTIIINENNGYPISSLLFTKVEGFYIAEDGIARYSSLGQMKIRLIPNSIEIKLTSIVNHTPHIYLILEYVKPRTLQPTEPVNNRVWSNEFNSLFQNNSEVVAAR